MLAAGALIVQTLAERAALQPAPLVAASGTEVVEEWIEEVLDEKKSFVDPKKPASDAKKGAV